MVAIIDGHQIKADDFKVDEMTVARVAGTSIEDGSMDLAKKSMEEERFIREIYRYILDKNIDEYRIQVTQEEVDEKLDEKFSKAGVNDKTAKQLNHTYSQLAIALEEKLNNPNMQSDVIYNRFLASTSIKVADWNLFLRSYNTRKKIDQLRALIPESVDDMKQTSRISTQRDLLIGKLKDVITSQSKNELADKEKTAYWNKWLKAQFEGLTITVFDQRFYDLLDSLGVQKLVFENREEEPSFQGSVVAKDTINSTSVSNTAHATHSISTNNGCQKVDSNESKIPKNSSGIGRTWLFYTFGLILIATVIFFVYKKRKYLLR